MQSSDDKLIREKLIARGINSLSDSELLSLIFDDKTNRLSLAKEFFKMFNNDLSLLSSEDLKSLRTDKGLDLHNATRLLSAIELGRRIASCENHDIQSINSNQDIYNLFTPLLSHLKHEEFWVLYLNASNGIIEKAKISQGGVASMIVDHKLIIKRAVELLASGLVIVHNHPSGNLTPSSEDITLTEKLVLGASLFEINVLDHVIITPNNNVSFKKLGIF